MLNALRLTGDMLHLASFVLLWWKMKSQRSCAGISLKSCELYLLVFITRYLDLFTTFISPYNTVMKMFYLAASIAVIYSVRVSYRATYDKAHDSFRYEVLVIGAALLTLVLNFLMDDDDDLSPLDLLWDFSVMLEAVAIVPQLWMLQRTKEVETITADYVATLGLYRAFYLANWIYGYFFVHGVVLWFVWISGLVQTVIYCDFLFIYFRSRMDGGRIILPA
eukprot:TRINITY_DN9525_c0_g1_i1.p1 TRINITY_DN9525_c0_g1~~TRINITY_DN9525_c0_g1_i1.p1  ORF type:complete len:221 (+),score=94.75 TRINITY_DN9525_c0_g1_i1:138-800(+)